MKRFLVCTVLAAMAALPAAAQRPRQQSTAIPAGTVVEIRIDNHLSSENSQEGETFTGTLPNAVIVGGRTVFQKNALVDGHVTRVKPSGRLSDSGELELVIDRIAGKSVNIEPFAIKGASHTKGNVAKIGGGTAVGAIIGGLAGGGKGAAIGAAVGAASGTGVAAATGKKEAIVESEAILPFKFAGGTVGVANNVSGRNDVIGRRDEQDSVWNQEAPEFSARDRRVIRSCMLDSRGNLPPGLAKKDRLPPGLERQLQRNGTLPPGLQKRIRPLPLACEERLPRLPRTIERVILNRHILLLESQNRILDLFNLDEE